MITKLEKDYLEKVDACFGLESNPELRDIFINILDDVISKYQELDYSQKHYKGLYDNFLKETEKYVKAGDSGELNLAVFSLFYAYQDKLKNLSDHMDWLLGVVENSSVFDKVRERASEFYNKVCTNESLTESFIESYTDKIILFNDCLVEVDSFLTYEMPYNVPHFVAHAQNELNDFIDYSCLLQLEKLKTQIENFKDSPYNDDLHDLSVLLNKLETIKESSDDYSFNDKIEELLKGVSETSYLDYSTIKEYAQKSKMLIHEYRYG
jgi:hypothetical protein